MFLKSLTLKGFKSFAESTTLELQPGICVVVGPNGSGKSNVVDAIGWVLGAQAPSTVRSQKMDDVIFAGTAKRPALGRAEVSLTIDNSAGLLPIEFSEVTITRTLFRSGDSEYAINGVSCRLLDIQELLSDTGVGRQQHVIISQGQIDAVLNAQPEARRLIIEEAAGILKYRKRKEKAERRLASTETNLTRVQDLLREVRRQLRPLERQAEAARRHDAVAAELHALRVHIAGQQLRRLHARLDQASQLGRDLGERERGLRTHLSELDAAVAAAEQELSLLGGDDLGDALARYESLHERARGLTAVLAERRRGLDRARNAVVDAAVVATFEAEAARLAAELDDVERDAAGLAPDAEHLAAAEAALAAESQAFQREWADGVPAPPTHAAEARGELGALRAAVDRGTNEVDRLRQRLAALAAKQRRLDDEAERLGSQRAEADASEAPLIEQLGASQRARKEADAALIEAEERRRTSHAESHSWSARADALALALDEARARAGAARLAEVGGVVGALFDLVEIDPGWEAAFEAAAGEAIAAVVVQDVSAARRALALLHAGDATGAVLALDATSLTGALHHVKPPAMGEPLRSHIRSTRAGVDRLIDAIVGDAVAVDSWEHAVDVALAHPTAVVVTLEGDRLTTSGWRVGAGATGATSAALAEARERAAAATAVADRLTRVHEEASRRAEDTRQREVALTRERDQNEARLIAAAQGLSKVNTERDEARAESESLQAHIADLAERVERDRARVGELESMLPELEAAEAAIAERAQAMADARARLDEHAAALGALRSDFDVRAASVDERRGFLRRRLGEVEDRLSSQRVEREEAEARRVDVERQQIAVDRLASYVAARDTVIERELTALRERRRRQSEAARQVASRLDGHRRARVTAERELEDLREEVRRAEIDHAEVKLRLEQAVENVRHDLDCEPEAALESAPPALAEGVTAPTRVRDLERELRLMGPINPLALQEFEALQERHEFLQAQLDDVKTTRRDLTKVIRAVDSEIVSVFAAAYADVEANFRQLVETLFPGGTGRLKLSEPDNLLDTGVEVEARPSGKNVRKLSLLSGGERSLVALAYLFAVFRARPSPFYVMDEVEAALDDVNLHRFLDLIHEFRAEAQLLVVSHQKRTMEAADVLYGVAMQDGGSSKVISERVTAGA